MAENKNILSVLRDARRKAVQNAIQAGSAGDLGQKIAWEARRLYLESVLENFREHRSGVEPGKRVFISYSVNSGTLFFNHLRKRLEETGFEVLTGFQRLKEDGGNVLKRILGQLRRSSVYLGLLTKEMQVSLSDGTHRWSPSVWTMEEKGMALALGKPFVLMVQEGIHNDFWLKTAPDKVHELFNDQNFFDKAESVIEAVTDRYEEFALKILNEGSGRLP